VSIVKVKVKGQEEEASERAVAGFREPPDIFGMSGGREGEV